MPGMDAQLIDEPDRRTYLAGAEFMLETLWGRTQRVEDLTREELFAILMEYRAMLCQLRDEETETELPEIARR